MGARSIAVIELLTPQVGALAASAFMLPKYGARTVLNRDMVWPTRRIEDAGYNGQVMRNFVGVNLSQGPVPDATTRLKSRRRLYCPTT